MARPIRALTTAMLVAALTVTAVTPTTAALWAALTVSPASPVAGEPAEVLVRTFATVGEGAVGELERPDGPMPAPSGNLLLLIGPAYPDEVRALGPLARELEIEVRPDPRDASLHRGGVTFPEAGYWTVWLPQFGQPTGPRNLPGVRLEVTVASPTKVDPEPDPAVVLLVAGLGLGGILLLRRVSAARPPGAS
ncbi:MAG TPA: hypothetical protein VM344_10625 [Vitreimonas sp.]|nr:hypothetical protein [Vitreimonas sp.]